MTEQKIGTARCFWLSAGVVFFSVTDGIMSACSNSIDGLASEML